MRCGIGGFSDSNARPIPHARDCSIQLNYYKEKDTHKSVSCDSGATRTLDPQLRRLLLYPTELRNHFTAAKIHFFSIVARKSSTFPIQRGKMDGIFYCDFMKLTSPFFSIICLSLSGKGSKVNTFVPTLISPLSRSRLTSSPL